MEIARSDNIKNFILRDPQNGHSFFFYRFTTRSQFDYITILENPTFKRQHSIWVYDFFSAVQSLTMNLGRYALWVCLGWVIACAGCLNPTAQPGRWSTPIPTSATNPATSTALVIPSSFTPSPQKQIPSPTSSITQPVTATAKAFPISSPTASPQPSQLPTPTIDLDPIQFLAPGDGSALRSPVDLRIQFLPAALGKIFRIEMRDHAGTLLYRRLLFREQLPSPGDQFDGQIDFEIGADARDVFVTVSAEDIPGQPIAVNTINLRLLSSGSERHLPTSWQPAALEIRQPATGADLSGGLIDVAGLVRLVGNDSLRVQIVDESGKVVGQRLARVEVHSANDAAAFSAQVSYKVSQITPARVVVFQTDPQTGLIQYLASIPVSLEP